MSTLHYNIADAYQRDILLTEFTCIKVALSTRELLRDIARHEGVSTAALVAAMANAEADAIGDDINAPPDTGIGVWRASVGGEPTVVLSRDTAPLVVFNPEEAELLANQIDRTITARSRFGLITQRAHRQILVFRRGRGVVLGINSSERAVTVGCARDIAKALRNCAAAPPKVSAPSTGPASAPSHADVPTVREPVAEGAAITYSPGAVPIAPPGYSDFHGENAPARDAKPKSPQSCRQSLQSRTRNSAILGSRE
jgi:hypothetical protein